MTTRLKALPTHFRTWTSHNEPYWLCEGLPRKFRTTFTGTSTPLRSLTTCPDCLALLTTSAEGLWK